MLIPRFVKFIAQLISIQLIQHMTVQQKAMCIHVLYRKQIPDLLDFIYWQCIHIITKPSSVTPEMLKQMPKLDWYQYAVTIKTEIDEHKAIYCRYHKLFANVLFAPCHHMLIYHCILNYVEERPIKDTRFLGALLLIILL